MIRPSNQTGPQHKLCDRAASSPQFNHVTTVDQWVYQWVLVSVLLCGSVPHSEQQSVQFFLCRFLFERRCLRAHRALYGSLHQPGGQVDGEERPAGRPQPVPPDPALRFHPDPPAGGDNRNFIHTQGVKLQKLNYTEPSTWHRWASERREVMKTSKTILYVGVLKRGNKLLCGPVIRHQN